jgi:hypothetical protein
LNLVSTLFNVVNCTCARVAVVRRIPPLFVMHLVGG